MAFAGGAGEAASLYDKLPAILGSRLWGGS